MNFKCFINLLEEKKYIKKIREFEVDSEEEHGNIAIDYECKYNEIKTKIIEEIQKQHNNKLLGNIKYQTNYKLKDNEIKIIFMDKLEHHIWNKMGHEENRSFKVYEMGYIWLESVLEDNDYYEAKYNSIHDIWNITDLFIKNDREEKEKKEKEECLNFLKQLP